MKGRVVVLSEKPFEAGELRFRSIHDLEAMLELGDEPTTWILLDSAHLLTALLKARMALDSHPAPRWTLLSLEPSSTSRHLLLSKLFHPFLPIQHTTLPTSELVEALEAPNSRELCIHLHVDQDAGTLTATNADLETFVVPLDRFQPNKLRNPDFGRPEIRDWGQVLAFGDYEVAFDSVLYDVDAEYRRQVKRNRVQMDPSLGGSIRRLRLDRRLRRSDFPGVDAKTIARIERGETLMPQKSTLHSIAQALDVCSPEDLASY